MMYVTNDTVTSASSVLYNLNKVERFSRNSQLNCLKLIGPEFAGKIRGSYVEFATASDPIYDALNNTIHSNAVDFI